MMTTNSFAELRRSFLTSHLARRIFFHIVGCALLPVLFLAFALVIPEAGDWESGSLGAAHLFTPFLILVVILAVILVMARSWSQLRHFLALIQSLKEGADRIAQKDFSHRIVVKTNDEFKELASGFNKMSRQLGRHFKMLTAQAQIDQATLMASSFGHIAALSITRILTDYRFPLAAICRVDVETPNEAQVYLGRKEEPEAITSQSFSVEDLHLNRFRPDRPWITIKDPADVDRFLPAGSISALASAVLFPVFVKEELFAILVVGRRTGPKAADSRLPLLRQFADHLAVAWSNVKLIRDQQLLTIESIRALAQTVDAKSPWTAGHSARVMRICLNIARHMGLDAQRIGRLQQAALLHDIGKIGVPSAILDKPGILTEEEFATIRKHPEISDRILRPIKAFQDLIPMVRQHHERWDGKGYPDGLAGESITLEARILAVADVYDAMTSDRPHREGMEEERVLYYLASESGRQFDPDVIHAFMSVIKEKSSLAA